MKEIDFYLSAYPYKTEQEMMIAKSEVNRMVSEGWEILDKGFENRKCWLVFGKEKEEEE